MFASVVCFMVLLLRRLLCKGELGHCDWDKNLPAPHMCSNGPKHACKTTCNWISGILLIVLWFLLVLFTAFNCYDVIGTRQIFVPDVATTAAQINDPECPD